MRKTTLFFLALALAVGCSNTNAASEMGEDAAVATDAAPGRTLDAGSGSDPAPPSQPAVRIYPETPHTLDDLYLTIGSSVDPGGAQVMFDIEWKKNGVTVPAFERLIPAAETARGDVWTVEVTARTPRSEAMPVQASVTIDNTAPELRGVSLNRYELIAGDNLTIQVDDAVDADNDPLTYRHEWFVSGRPVGSTEGTTASFDLWETAAAGDTIRVSVTASDGSGSAREEVGPLLVHARPRYRQLRPQRSWHESLELAPAAYENRRGRVLYLDTTNAEWWEYVVSTARWTKLVVESDIESELARPQFFADEANEVLWVFGEDETGIQVSTLSLSGIGHHEWNEVAIEDDPAHGAPSVAGALLAPDPDRQRFYFLGGQAGETPSTSIWSLETSEGLRWRRLGAVGPALLHGSFVRSGVNTGVAIGRAGDAWTVLSLTFHDEGMTATPLGIDVAELATMTPVPSSPPLAVYDGHTGRIALSSQAHGSMVEIDLLSASLAESRRAIAGQVPIFFTGWRTYPMDSENRRYMALPGTVSGVEGLAMFYELDLNANRWSVVQGPSLTDPGETPETEHSVDTERLVIPDGSSHTWQFHFAADQWERHEATAAPGGELPALFYVLGATSRPDLGDLLLVGSAREATYSELWTLTDGEWQGEAIAGGKNSPYGNLSGGVIFESPCSDDILMHFGGERDELRSASHRLRCNETGCRWLPVAYTTVPSARRDAAGVTLGSSFMLFGGRDESGALGDLWTTDACSGTVWSPLLTTGDAPSPRSGHTLVNAGESGLILFGGESDLWPLGDTFVLRENTWHRLVTEGRRPAGRTGHIAAWDAHHHRMVIIGGHVAGFLEFSDQWELLLAPPTIDM